MVARNSLSEAPPYAVESALRARAGPADARVRRNLTLDDARRRSERTARVADAERGKPTTHSDLCSAVVAYGLLEGFGEVADPSGDVEG